MVLRLVSKPLIEQSRLILLWMISFGSIVYPGDPDMWYFSDFVLN